VENEELDLVEGLAPSRAENQRLGIVEGLIPSKTEEKPTNGISIRRAGYVGAPATPGVMAHCRKEKKIRKPLDDCDTCGSTGTLAVSHSGQVALMREQWEPSEN
jgi:hypothetical protein